MDPVRQIQSFNRGREPERLALKYKAMRADAFGFLRGSCHLFYARLPQSGVLRSAPLAWCCGDLHLANFGSYKGDNRLVYFDLNDFDEAVLAPASWDLVRLLSSVWVAAGTLRLGRGLTRRLCTSLLTGYADALAGGKAFWAERDTANGAIRELLDRTHDRQRPDFLDARTHRKGRGRVLTVDTGKALPATAAQRAAVITFMAQFAASQAVPGFFKVQDVARRVAGTGSLGVERYSVLVKGKGSPDGNYLLDLKRANVSSLVARNPAPQPRWPTEAQRTVDLQQRLQAMPMAFLHPVMMDGKPFVLRALHPSEDRIDIGRCAGSDSAGLLADLGRLTAWAHLRSAARQGAAGPDELIDFGSRQKWRAKLQDAAEASAVQGGQDYASFSAAYDAGSFGA